MSVVRGWELGWEFVKMEDEIGFDNERDLEYLQRKKD